ncbi:YgiT-type zinc finger protein [bacterium]|nr:YgiT-type zinc finger protein [bacterium]
MKCLYCKGEMKRGTAPIQVDHNGVHLSLERVPAWVCGQCGEPYFEEAEVEAIQSTLAELDKKIPQFTETA